MDRTPLAAMKGMKRSELKKAMQARRWEVNHEYRDRVEFYRESKYGGGYIRIKCTIWQSGNYTLRWFTGAQRSAILSHLEKLPFKDLVKVFKEHCAGGK